MQPTWPTVTVAGQEMPSGGNSGVEVTPEYLAKWLEGTNRPDNYQEGNVFIRLTYSDLARLFGDVTITYSEDAE